MDVRAIHTPSFRVLTPSPGARKGQSPATEKTAARESTGPESSRHPVLTAEEQRYFESAFPASAKEPAGSPTYSGGGIRQQSPSGTLVDRKV
jgi:hypothetical protein